MMKQNILIVDDHRENLVALEAILDAPDRNLVMAASGNEALNIALKQDFALILLDVQMPEMDGFEVAELMRKNRRTRGIPIIFVTAISKEDRYVFKGYECGAVDYLFKPIDQQILEAKVGVFLELDMQRRKLQQAVVQMKRLKDENERLLQALGEGIIGTDEQGTVTFCNAAACTLLDLPRDQVEGGSVDQLIFNDEAGELRWKWQDSPMLAACRQGETWRGDTPMFARSQEPARPLLLSANPINPPDEDFSGMVLLLRDATDLHLDDAEAQAREARRFPRKKMYREMVMFNRDTGGNVGRLLNISVDGFKLFTRHIPNEGEKLALSMVLPEQICGVNTMSFEARNVWHEEEHRPGEYHAGFQFIDLSDTNRNIIEALIERY
jgi:CheY-like chemotaxis protein